MQGGAAPGLLVVGLLRRARLGQGMLQGRHATVIPEPMSSTQPLASWRNSHTHGSHYNPILQQPALLAGHVTLPSNQPLNVSSSSSSSQPVLSPQRSKRVKENTPPRCAVLQNNVSFNCPAASAITTAPAHQSCNGSGGGGWGSGGGGGGGGQAEQASSTTCDHHHHHHQQQHPHHHHHHHNQQQQQHHHVPRQTIIIPDTPSPAVSIITISSDTDDEDDHKQRNSNPCAMETRVASNNNNNNHHGYDSKSAVLDNYGNMNSRTIIIPPLLKTQGGDALAECDRLMPDAMNHQNSAYKFKSTNGVVSGNNHLPGGMVGVGSYRHQRSGPHPFQQQQPLNLSQAQQHMIAERGAGHRRQQAYIAPTMVAQAPYSFHHNSPSSHTGNLHPHPHAHPHLTAAHLPGQPQLYAYAAGPPAGTLGSGGATAVAHLVASQGPAHHGPQHTGYPPAAAAAAAAAIVHQVPVSMGHGAVLPSPTLQHHHHHHASAGQYQVQPFAHHHHHHHHHPAYISASPAATATMYTGYPLSPAKVNQYPYL
ncbi:hypothetical protein CRUP_037247 [Coryphaenoides rupestris]|nr:hypothetical protein CRUP_037247 [Coryphaenoides rupestris]